MCRVRVGDAMWTTDGGGPWRTSMEEDEEAAS